MLPCDVCGRDAVGSTRPCGLCRSHSRTETELNTIVQAAIHFRTHSRPTCKNIYSRSQTHHRTNLRKIFRISSIPNRFVHHSSAVCFSEISPPSVAPSRRRLLQLTTTFPRTSLLPTTLPLPFAARHRAHAPVHETAEDQALSNLNSQPCES